MNFSPGALQHRTQGTREFPERHSEKNALAVIAALKACIRSKNVERGRKIHWDATENGVESNIFVASTLINMYSKCGSLIEACRVFDAVKNRSAVAWNVMMLGFAENGQGALALDLLDSMSIQGVIPDSQTFVAALKACASFASQEQYRKIGGKVLKMETLEKVMAIHSRAMKIISAINSFVSSSLIDVYGKCGSMEDSERAFSSMDSRDVVSWNALMLGYAENGEEDLAMKVLRWMELDGCLPNDRSFVAALKACTGAAEKEEPDGDRRLKVRAIEKGMALHSRAAATGSDRDKFVASALIDMYAKCSSVADARSAFDRIDTARRDAALWNALILGYADNHDSDRALELFQRMLDDGRCDPNSRTFMAALKACGNSQALGSTKFVHGLVTRWNFAERDGTVANSLVDVYGKCGSVLDSHQVFDSITGNKDPITWTSLLAGYARLGDSDRVLELFRSMLSENVLANSATFVILLTAYSHCGAIDRSTSLLKSMLPSFGIAPKSEHFVCVIDCLTRAGKLDEALRLVNDMPHGFRDVAWMTVLGSRACHSGGRETAEVGGLAFESLLQLNGAAVAPYPLMANILGAQIVARPGPACTVGFIGPSEKQ